MIASRAGHNTLGKLLWRQRRYLVVGSAYLEREDRLQVFALEVDRVAVLAREHPRLLQRRLVAYIVNASIEDFVEVSVR